MWISDGPDGRGIAVAGLDRAVWCSCSYLLRKGFAVTREVIEKLIDDLDGSEAAETVTFGLDGASYQIDLTKRNAAALRKALERYVKAARRSAPSRALSRRDATTATKATKVTTKPQRGFDIVQLREWAGANNVAIPSRGRIPQTVVEQYKAAGGG